MAILKKLKVTRDQLAEFIKNHNTIKQFERLFDYVNGFVAPVLVEITDSTDVVVTLPDPSEVVGERVYKRYGTGTGKLTLNCLSGVVLNWGDAETSTVDIEGSGTLVVYASDDQLQVRVYDDSGTIVNSGADQDRSWEKRKNGSMIVYGISYNNEDSTIGLKSETASFGKTFTSIKNIVGQYEQGSYATLIENMVTAAWTTSNFVHVFNLSYSKSYSILYSV